jgi:hypothetical protein
MKGGNVGQTNGRDQRDHPLQRLMLVRYGGLCAHRSAERGLGSGLLGEMEAIRAVILAIGAHVRHHGHFHRHVVCPHNRHAHPHRNENGKKQREALSERPTIHGLFSLASNYVENKPIASQPFVLILLRYVTFTPSKNGTIPS